MDMLQRRLDECLQWYVSLANHIAKHQTQEGFAACVAASSLDKQERQRQQSRREALQKARDDERRGAVLVQEREDRKRSYDDTIVTAKFLVKCSRCTWGISRL